MFLGEINAYQSVNFPRNPSEGKNLLFPDATVAVMVDVVVVSAVAIGFSRCSVVLGVGGSQNGKIGNLDEESGRRLPDEAVPA